LLGKEDRNAMDEIERKGLWRGRSALRRIALIVASLILIELVAVFIAQQNVSA
jgi:hypothetical protein